MMAVTVMIVVQGRVRVGLLCSTLSSKTIELGPRKFFPYETNKMFEGTGVAKKGNFM